MLVISLENIVEAAVADRSRQNIGGYIKDIDKLFCKDNLRMLEESHKGIFAFLAFHPKSDSAIIKYLQKGSLGFDSGNTILVMFALGEAANTPQPINEESFKTWLIVDQQSCSSYEIVRRLFEKSPPPLPGIVFIDKLSELTEPVFVSFEGKETADEVKSFARKVFHIAEQSYNEYLEEQDGEFAAKFCVRLAQKEIEYYRALEKSILEWIIYAFNLVKKNSESLVSIVKIFV